MTAPCTVPDLLCATRNVVEVLLCLLGRGLALATDLSSSPAWQSSGVSVLGVHGSPCAGYFFSLAGGWMPRSHGHTSLWLLSDLCQLLQDKHLLSRPGGVAPSRLLLLRVSEVMVRLLAGLPAEPWQEES